MPTLTWLDSFFHQQTGATFYGTGAGVYDTNNGIAQVSFVPGRRPGSFAMQIVQNGVTSARVGKLVPAGNRTIVESFYARISAAPSVTSNFYLGLATINSQIQATPAGGWQYNAGSGSPADINGGANLCDGVWHRVDVKWVTSGTTYTLDLSVDGVAQTQHVSNATTAADITESRLGSNNGAHTATIQYADWVRSVTAADHPLGAHQCLALIPNQDGTHSWLSTNMGNHVGGTAAGTTSTLWQEVRDWPADITTYIQYTNTTATGTDYAEILLPDDNTNTIWGARAIAAIMSAAATANSATTRVVDGSGTTVLDLYTGDMSDITLRHQASMVPSITTQAALNALKFRVGFPTDSNPAPWWSALMVDYAVAGAGPAWSRPPTTLVRSQAVNRSAVY